MASRILIVNDPTTSRQRKAARTDAWPSRRVEQVFAIRIFVDLLMPGRTDGPWSPGAPFEGDRTPVVTGWAMATAWAAARCKSLSPTLFYRSPSHHIP